MAAERGSNKGTRRGAPTEKPEKNEQPGLEKKDGTGEQVPENMDTPNAGVVEVVEPEVAAEEGPISFAPGFASCSSIYGLNSVIIDWMEPNEGPADEYVIEIVGVMEPLTVPGDAKRIQIDGLPPLSEVVTRVTARTGDDEGTLECPPVLVNEYAPVEAPAAPEDESSTDETA